MVPASIEKLAGSAFVREQLLAGVHPNDFTASWRGYEAAFADERAPYLLYQA